MSQMDVLSKIESYHDHVRHDVIPHVPDSDGKLLDLGGGIGATAATLKKMGKAAQVGVADMIDNSDELLDLDFRFQGDLEDPALLEKIVAEQGKFDVILALDILEHLRDPWTVARSLAEMLKEGGSLVASIPNVRNYKALLPLLMKNQWQYRDAGILDRTHLRFFVRSTAIDLVKQTGLDITGVYASPSGGRKIKLFRAVTLGLLNSFTDRQYIVVAQKR